MDDRMKSGWVTKWDIYIYIWLMVYLPLWKICVRQFGWWFPIYGNIKFMFQTTSQMYIYIYGLYGWFIIHNHNPYFIPYIIHTNGMKTWVRLMDKLNHGSYISGMHIQVCASWIPCLRLYDLHGYQPRSTYFHRTDCMGLSESFRHTQVPLLYPIKCRNYGWFTPSFLLQKSPN